MEKFNGYLDATECVCVTGVTGYVGSNLVKNLLRNHECSILGLIHASHPEEFDEKASVLMEMLPDNCEARLTLLPFDLWKDDAFRNIPVDGVTTIIHSAAVTQFNVDLEVANKINVEGTHQTLVYASSCTKLKKFLQISTVYASGKSSGAILEEVLSKPSGFANHYERSKWEAESKLVKEFDDLPWNIVRLATIIADDDFGCVTQYNVFHNTIRLLYMGLTSVVPGEENTPLYFITGDLVQKSIDAILTHQFLPKSIFHVCPPLERTCSLGQLMSWLHLAFTERDEYKKKRIMQPLLVEYDAFSTLADTLDGMAGLVVRQALESMRPFSQQMFVSKQFDCRKMASILNGYVFPDMQALTDKVVNTVLASRS